MPRIIWFGPALATLLLAAILGAIGEHRPTLRILGIACVLASVWLARYAQRRAPPSRHKLSPGGAMAIIAGIVVVTLLLVIVEGMVVG